MARPKSGKIDFDAREDNGVYYVFWYDEKTRRTKRRSLDTRDFGEAQRKCAEFILRGEASRDRSDAGLTVGQALDDYLREHVTAEDDKGRTRVVDVGRIEGIVKLLKAYFEKDALKDIDIIKSRAYRDHRRAMVAGGKRPRKNNVKDPTIRKELAILVAAANHAVRWKRLSRNDMPQIELPHVEKPVDPKWFTKDQIKELLEAAKDDNVRAYILIGYYTAARRRSIEGLTPFQVKLEEGAIYLQPPDGRVTKKRRPTVPIFPEIRATVARLHACNKDKPYLFGERAPNFYPEFRRACRKIGVPHGHPHMLRHSRASHMLQDGEDIWKVARLLGDTVATVERVYAHCMPQHLLSGSNIRVIPTLEEMIG